MVDPATIGTAYAGLKWVKERFDKFVGDKIEDKVKERVLKEVGNAQDMLFDLREDLFRLQTERDELRKKVDAMEQWDARISSYELKVTVGGARVYFSKTDPQIMVCPACTNKKEIQFLQDQEGQLECPGCKHIYYSQPSGPVEVISDFDPFDRNS